MDSALADQAASSGLCVSSLSGSLQSWVAGGWGIPGPLRSSRPWEPPGLAVSARARRESAVGIRRHRGQGTSPPPLPTEALGAEIGIRALAFDPEVFKGVESHSKDRHRPAEQEVPAWRQGLGLVL